MPHLRRTLFLITSLACLTGTSLTGTSLIVGEAEAQTTGRPGPCLPTDASCRADDSKPKRTKIDLKFGFLKQIIDEKGRGSAVFGPKGAPADLTKRHVGATLRFVDELPEHVIADFERRGVQFMRDEAGQLVRVGAIYLALVDWSAFEFLAKHPLLVRAESTWRPIMLSPLEVTSEMVGASYAHQRPDFGVDGDGVTVADIDSGFDVLHPHLFRADGGYYSWQDADENGQFNAGDTLDHDGDGTSDVLRVLDGTRTMAFEVFENDDNVLQPRYDWVYLDVNDDETRNVGPEAGFVESDPAYGEPIFVVDDVDRDGVLEPGEKLVRLKTSKFRKITFAGVEYVRGQNLIAAAGDEVNLQPSHGTAVASIVGGGQKGFHNPVGLAPGVDILGYAYGGQSSQDDPDESSFGTQIRALSDALDEDAALMLHEWTDIVWQTPDGSSNLEKAMDEARAQGMIQVNPMGNLNLAEKHVFRDLEPGDELNLGFEIGEGYGWGPRTYPYNAVYMSVFWRGEEVPRFWATLPNGETTELPISSNTISVGAMQIWGGYERTDRGTHHAGFVVWRDDRESLMRGGWTIHTDAVEQNLEVSARIADMYSSWGVGVAWNEPTRDYGTMVFPSSADSALGVAAHAGRHAEYGEDGSLHPGALRGYSGRGPRIDGARGVDIAAPDDPYAAQGVNGEYLEAGIKRNWFRTFGGTSGAGPHVAASIALLKQQNPDWSADQIEEALLQATRSLDLSPSYGIYPNPHWGFGQVDVFRALYGMATERPSASNQPPAASLSATLEFDAALLDASASTDPDADALEYRFDYDYDGAWDTDWRTEPTITVDLNTYRDNEVTARVSTRDSSGLESGALVSFNTDDAPPPKVVVHESEQTDADEPGCQCDTTSSTTGSGAGILLAILALVAARRNRRKPA